MTDSTSPNVVWHHASVTRVRRAELNGHRSALLWFTGLPSAGKSTLAHATEEHLHRNACRTFVLDGDNVRHGLCSDLGFDATDRSENIRRIGEVAKLFVEASVITLAAFISPLRAQRERVRQLFAPGDFLEIYVKCPVAVCESRDVKGMYQRARAGEIKQYTGVSAPYEEPLAAELTLDTAQTPLSECVDRVVALLQQQGVLASGKPIAVAKGA